MPYGVSEEIWDHLSADERQYYIDIAGGENESASAPLVRSPRFPSTRKEPEDPGPEDPGPEDPDEDPPTEEPPPPPPPPPPPLNEPMILGRNSEITIPANWPQKPIANGT